MTQTPPTVRNGLLFYQQGGQSVQLAVDSSGWYSWLESALTFTFRGEHCNFTARKEQAGNGRGRLYWRAYHTRKGKLQRVYLGQSAELTLLRLQAVAARLAGEPDAAPFPPDPGLMSATTPPRDDNAQTHARLHQKAHQSVLIPAKDRRSPQGAAVWAKLLYALTVLVWFQEEYARLEALGEEQFALCRLIGDQSGIALGLCALAGVAFRQGDAARARALSEQSVTAARAAENPYLNAALLLFLGRLVSNQGDHPRARILFEESLSLMRGMGYQGDIAWPLIYLARELITQGEPASARVLLEEAVTLCRAVRYKWALAHALGYLGQVLLEQGGVAGARECLRESLRLNQEVGNRRSIAWSLFLLASVVAAQGKGEEARALYEQGLTIATALEHRGLIASCLQGLATLMAVQEQPDLAVRLWGKAEAIQRNSLTSLPHTLQKRAEQARARARTQLGAERVASALAEGRAMTPAQLLDALQAARAQLHGRGGRIRDPHNRTLVNPARLTVRELDVLRLVATGLTDAQIAEQLVISPRTVSWHLSSIYGKIEVSSRAAATRFALEHGLL